MLIWIKLDDCKTSSIIKIGTNVNRISIDDHKAINKYEKKSQSLYGSKEVIIRPC